MGLDRAAISRRLEQRSILPRENSKCPFQEGGSSVLEIPIFPGHIRRAVVVFGAALLLFACTLALFPRTAAADPAVGVSVWHRLNPNAPGFAAPAHERLGCLNASVFWACRYDQPPEPSLNFFAEPVVGYFVGHDITRGWTCPAWFPSSICQNVTRVVGGTVRYFPANRPPVDVAEDLVFTGTGTSLRLWVYWVNQFVSPWFPTFAQALAANPIPLPFNGTDWPAQDTTFAS